MVDHIDIILLRIVLAVIAGGLIGFERLHRGRPAGFRTHALVCAASSLLMLLTAFQWDFVPPHFMQTVRVDPTRMAQGIMTGIGFLGAGVIVKERLTVRGLTTAASIWSTAALGILYGLGFYVAALAGTAVALLVLSLFQYIEEIMPTSHYARLQIAFAQPPLLSEDELLELMRAHHVHCVNVGYDHNTAAKTFRYRTVVRTGHRVNLRQLAEKLREDQRVQSFTMDTTGE